MDDVKILKKIINDLYIQNGELIGKLAVARAKNERTCVFTKSEIGDFFESTCGLNGEEPDVSIHFCPSCGGKILHPDFMS